MGMRHHHYLFFLVNAIKIVLNGTSNRAIGTCNESGLINESVSLEFIDHIIKYSTCTVQEPILIILNNHYSYCSSSVVEKAKDSGIASLTLSPHTSHKLQPLDVSVLGPLKVFHGNAVDEWLRSHPGKMVSIYDISKIVTTALNLGFSRHNVVAEFAATGIYPLNKNMFGNSNFMPSAVTERREREIEIAEPSCSTSSMRNETSAYPSTRTNGLNVGISTVKMLISSNTTQNQSVENLSAVIHASKNALRPVLPASSVGLTGYVSPEQILPFPKAPPQKRQNRRRRKAIAFTFYKAELSTIPA